MEDWKNKSEKYIDVAFFTYDSPQVKEISQKFWEDVENIFTTTTPSNLDKLVTSECLSPDNRIKRKYSFQLSPTENKNVYENFFDINYEILKEPTQDWVRAVKAFKRQFYEVVTKSKESENKIMLGNVVNILSLVIEQALATTIIDKEAIDLTYSYEWVSFDDVDEKNIYDASIKVINLSREKSAGSKKENIYQDMKKLEINHKSDLERYQIFLLEAYKALWKNMKETDEYFVYWISLKDCLAEVLMRLFIITDALDALDVIA